MHRPLRQVPEVLRARGEVVDVASEVLVRRQLGVPHVHPQRLVVEVVAPELHPRGFTPMGEGLGNMGRGITPNATHEDLPR